MFFLLYIVWFIGTFITFVEAPDLYFIRFFRLIYCSVNDIISIILDILFHFLYIALSFPEIHDLHACFKIFIDNTYSC